MRYNTSSGRIEALIDLKDALVEGASGNYLTIMKPSNYWYKYEESFDYPGFAPSSRCISYYFTTC